MIATVAALSERVAFSQTLEVGASHIVEQQVVLEREQLAKPSAQMLFERLLVRQQLIQRAVEAMVVDPLARQPQQVFQRALTVPIFSNVQFAGRFGQARNYQHCRHLGPRDRFPARWHQLYAQFVQLERAPQLPSQPYPAEPARTLDRAGPLCVAPRSQLLQT